MLRVQKKMCSTCIYRPTSPLSIAKLEADVADPHMEGYFRGHRVCHHAPNNSQVCCRGFWEKHKDHFTLGQVAQRLNMVEFVNVDTLKIPRGNG